MVLRNIVIIDEDKCNGCGLCVNACAEGAIEVIDGKAKLVSEIYCDGLGACLDCCPQDAITVEKREVQEFDEQATEQHLARKNQSVGKDQSKTDRPAAGFVCPGSRATAFGNPLVASSESAPPTQSQLTHWPVQLMLVSPQAPYFKDADILIAADCVPFAMADFHNKLLAGRSLIIACPKLDDSQYYIEKLTELFTSSIPKSLAVAHMEVPCCFGLINIVKSAIANSQVDMPFRDVTIDLRGNIIKDDVVNV